jgi:hypothetical protein
LISGSIYFTSGGSKLNVDAERLTISEVQKAAFREFYSCEWNSATRKQPFTWMLLKEEG